MHTHRSDPGQHTIHLLTNNNTIISPSFLGGYYKAFLKMKEILN